MSVAINNNINNIIFTYINHFLSRKVFSASVIVLEFFVI